MITVQRHGNKTRVTNPVTGEKTDLIDVIFVERGRGGANESLANSSAALSAVLGKNVGLEQIRTHTQAVKAGEIGDYPVGKPFPLYINRILLSEPAMRQQEGRPARRIGGRPTFFVTELSQTPQADVDKRESNSVLAMYNPGLLSNTFVGGAEVEILELVEAPAAQAQAEAPVVHQPLS